MSTVDEFIKKLPEIIKAASKEPRSFLVLCVLLTFLLALSFFASSSEPLKIFIFLALFSCVACLALLVLNESNENSRKRAKVMSREKMAVWFAARIALWGLMFLFAFAVPLVVPMQLYFGFFIFFHIGLIIPFSILMISLAAPIPPRYALAGTLFSNLLAVVPPLYPFVTLLHIEIDLGADVPKGLSFLAYFSLASMLINMILVALANKMLYVPVDRLVPENA